MLIAHYSLKKSEDKNESISEILSEMEQSTSGQSVSLILGLLDKKKRDMVKFKNQRFSVVSDNLLGNKVSFNGVGFLI